MRCGSRRSDALAKVHTDAQPGPNTPLQLFAGRNEFESFQVHVLAGSSPVQLNVSVSDFTNSTTGFVIHAASNAILYREAYLNITQLSDANGSLGQTPDPLIPAQDPYTLEVRNAFPVTVPVNQVQSAWIDVLVPIAASPGNYTATVTVTDGGTTLAQLPVTLTVWAFILPSTATLKSTFGKQLGSLCIAAYGSYANCGNYPPSGGSAMAAAVLMDQAQARLLLDHRISIAPISLRRGLIGRALIPYMVPC
jgi:hypothetical protein